MEHCQDCGKKYNTVYTVPDDVWEKITPEEGEDGFLCIECADKRAYNIGVVFFWCVSEINRINDKNVKNNAKIMEEMELEIEQLKKLIQVN